MLCDEYGISCGLENMEKQKEFLDKREGKKLYKKLVEEIPWQEVTQNTGKMFDKLVFRYGDFERGIKKYDVLEELITYVEEVLETDITGLWCNLYRNGKDFTPYHQENYNSHVFLLTLGSSRKFFIRNSEEPETQKEFTLSHGDGFYFDSQTNRSFENSTPKIKSEKASMSILFFMDEPYSRRKRHFRQINLLGYGNIPVWFEGPESQFPQDAVASILPMPYGESYRGPLSVSQIDLGSSPSVDVDMLSSFILENVINTIYMDETMNEY